ncbi:MAG: dienelactone hydrolase family protein [Bacteroidota bacterium]
MKKPTQLDEYDDRQPYTFPLRNGVDATHMVYTLGNSKKIVILMQELPGINQPALALADRLVAKGFTVVIPHLFGRRGENDPVRNSHEVFCMKKEFYLFARNESSPIVDFLAQLCQAIKEKHQVKGVAVIGMCLTGNFAITLMASEAVLAGFASQPSMPIFGQRALHMSQGEIEKVKEKLDRVGPMHCGRFKRDFICRNRKFKSIKKTFNTENKERITCHTLKGFGHSILGKGYKEQDDHPTKQLFNTITKYFEEQLSN